MSDDSNPVGVNPDFSDKNFDYQNFEGSVVNNSDGSTSATVQFGPAHTLGPQNGRLDWVVPNRAVSVTVNGVLISTSLWDNWSSGSPPLYVVLLSFTVTNSPQTIVVSSDTQVPVPTPMRSITQARMNLTPGKAVGVNPSFSDSNFDYANFEGCYVQNTDGSTTATVQFGPAHASGPQNGRLDWVVPKTVSSITVDGVPLPSYLWDNWWSGSPPIYIVLLSFTVTATPQTIIAK